MTDDMAVTRGDDTPETRAARLEQQLRDEGVLQDGDIEERTAGAPTADRFAEGRRVVARAWADPEFRQRLLEDASSAVGELGMTVEAGHQPGLELHAVENTDQVHNLIVCTLCSCYPRALLGAPPAWYSSEAYRAKAVRDPVGVLADFGLELDGEKEVRVWDSTAETRYLVLPQRPEGSEGWTEEQLAELVTPDMLVGTAVATVPAQR